MTRFEWSNHTQKDISRVVESAYEDMNRDKLG